MKTPPLKIAFVVLALILTGTTLLFAPNTQAATRQPNLVFILADDLGWSDTSLYGSKFYETPNLERLAKRGMMFSNAYSASPLCSPTRASLLTGLYPGRIGVTAPVCHKPEELMEALLLQTPPSTAKAIQQISATRLSTKYFTLSKALKQAGYATGHFGKWHLGLEPYSALQQGFDVDLPHYPGPGPAGSYLAPWKFPNFSGPAGEHIEDRMTEEAIKFITENKDHPFYVNYWAFSVHEPWDAKPALIEKYSKKADPNSPQRNPVYAAMIQSLDENIGRLLDTLDKLGLTDNTVIVFFSDNGGVFWTGRSGIVRPDMKDIPITSNAPLRGGKATLYEGGTREPLVVSWPGHVQPGSHSDAFYSSVDFYPTMLDMLGIKPQPGQKFDGVSQLPTLLGKTAPRDTLFCFFPHYIKLTETVPGTWVRRGDWKLIRLHFDNEDQSDRFELYNLHEDISETNNLAAKHPDKVKELDALIEQHLKETNALVPKPNPNYQRNASTR